MGEGEERGGGGNVSSGLFPRQLCCVQHREGRCSLQSLSSGDIFTAAREEEQEQYAVIAISYSLVQNRIDPDWSFEPGERWKYFQGKFGICQQQVSQSVRIIFSEFK